MKIPSKMLYAFFTNARKEVSRLIRLALPMTLVFAIALLFSFALFRANQVEKYLGNSETCYKCFFRTTLASDLWLIALGLTIATCILMLRHALIRMILAAILLIILAITSADLLLYNSLSMRVHLTDISKFGLEFSSIISFLEVYFGTAWTWVVGALFLFLLVCLVVVAFSSSTYPKFSLLLSLLAIGCAAGAAVDFSPPVFHVHQETSRNWVILNLDQGVARAYSDDFAKTLTAKPSGVPPTCSPRTATNQPNVIVVVVESLSAYHSNLLGGHHWTPALDQVAREHSWFTNFHANGFTTDQGLIALLTGRFPLPSVGRYGSTKAYAGFEGDTDSLPGHLRRFGFETLFFTTGDLRFLDKGKWAESIGFMQVEGAEHPFYSGHPRLHFNAAEDALLFDRFLAWQDDRKKDKPYFATLLTVSSHPPFVTPDGRSHQEEAVIRGSMPFCMELDLQYRFVVKA